MDSIRNRPLTRFLRIALLTVVSAGLVTCQGDRSLITEPDSPSGMPGPSKVIQDASTLGTSGFYFLPPISKPSGLGIFDPNLGSLLSLEVYHVVAANVSGVDAVDGEENLFDLPALTCGQEPDPYYEAVGGSPYPVELIDDHYQVDWDTSDGGVASEFYRLLVCLSFGETQVELGFVDVFLGDNGKAAKSVDSEETIGLNDGRTLPVKFHVEDVALQEALCAGAPDCNAQSVPSNPPEDVVIPVDENADDDVDASVHIPAGTTFELGDGTPVPNMIFTIERCATGETLPVDLWKDDACYSINTTPPNVVLVNPAIGPHPSTVSICNLYQNTSLGTQEPNVSIHQFDFVNGTPPDLEFWEVLPHADEFCSSPLASAGSPFSRFAQNLKSKLLGWLGPEELIADVMMLHTGGGGRTGTYRSNFQAALTSRIRLSPNFTGDPLTLSAPVGTDVSPAPLVQVVDVDGTAVQGAYVRFEITSSGSAEINGATTVQRIATDPSGEATVDWTLLNTSNPHTVRAFAKGMVGPETADPIPGVPMPGVDPVLLSCPTTGPYSGVGCDEGATTSAAGITFQADAQAPQCNVDEDVCTATVPSGSTTDVLLELDLDDGQTNTDFSVFIPQGTQFWDPVQQDYVSADFELKECPITAAPMPTDKLLVGECFTVNTTPANLVLHDAGGGATYAVVSVCDLDDLTGLTTEQENRVTLHQFDVTPHSVPAQIDFMEALPHAPEYCGFVIGASENPLGRFASAVTERLADWLAPPALIADDFLHTGGGGRTGTFRSNFQFALPSWSNVSDNFPNDLGEPLIIDATVGQPAQIDGANPTVVVYDAGGNDILPDYVLGAWVRFEVPLDGSQGTIACPFGLNCQDHSNSSSSILRVETDDWGDASVEWTMPSTPSGQNPYRLLAYSLGMVNRYDGILMPQGWPTATGPTRVDCNDAGVGGSSPPACNDLSLNWGLPRQLFGLVRSTIEFEANAFGTSGPVLASCAGRGTGADLLFRGLYYPDYPGSTLDQVDMAFVARTAAVVGTHTLRLTARENAYDGPILGTSEVTLTIPLQGSGVASASFVFPSPSVTPGSTIAFITEQIAGPQDPNSTLSEIHYEGSNDTSCPVQKTENTTTPPPLNTDRGGKHAIVVRGTPYP